MEGKGFPVSSAHGRGCCWGYDACAHMCPPFGAHTAVCARVELDGRGYCLGCATCAPYGVLHARLTALLREGTLLGLIG